ncbi:nuclear transport factor 2 family protein [Nocardia speluncae]|uniref:Nuclear transport factor 2 family protein n=1 Tax=Nocardia speluncae TaxID=419477 RepID=A0A846XA81_9NOCA|nr:nuclear transport factor 2 family protein [Nocardia speluncae]NKY31959.1 nuclear transport factor 2 family protein [Nocardia speluncae]
MSDGELAELREHVRRLQAIEIARDHVHAYARTLDDPDPETVTALFAPDAVLTTPSRTARGVAEIRKFFESAFAADPSVKRHFIANVRTAWRGDSRVRVQSQFFFTGTGAGRLVLGWGSYDDLVDVGSDRPRFVEKVVVVEMSTDLVRGWSGEPVVR